MFLTLLLEHSFFDKNAGIGLAKEGLFNASRKLYTIEETGSVWTREERSFEKDYIYSNTSGPVRDGEDLYFTADSMIFHSTNRGESWKVASTIPGIFTLDHLQVYGEQWTVNATSTNLSTGAITYRILRSNNRGIAWDTLISTAMFSYAPSTIAFRDRNNGYYGTRGGKLYHTTNGGTTWDSVTQFKTAQLNDFAFFTDSLFYVVGNSGLIAHSTNAGNSWDTEYLFPQNEATPRLMSIRLAPDGLSAFIVGDGILLKGTFPEPVTSVRDQKRTQSHQKTLQLSVRPNPVVGEGTQLHITGLKYGNVEVTIFDITGRICWKGTAITQGVEQMTIPLNNWHSVPGVYRLIVRQTEEQASCSVTILQ